MATLPSCINYNFSVDLRNAVAKELQFLKSVDIYPALYEGSILKQAVYRYEMFWLPFAAQHLDRTLSAPLDIAWVWHCHMLAPLHYIRDCLHVCGVIVNHSLLPTTNTEDTKRLWDGLYPDNPFFLDLTKATPYFDISTFSSNLKYDLVEAASRQKVFFYQVSLPHYEDNKFINNGIQRYRKFLELKQCYPDNFIVPCYDIDVVWHAHQVHPVAYKQDTEYLLGKHFNHDDSVNDRSPGSKLEVSNNETKIIWKEKYSENFSCSGAMFRGLPPNGKLSKMPFKTMYEASSKRVVISVLNAEVVADSNILNKIRSLEFEAQIASGMYLKLLKMKNPVMGKWSTENRGRYNWDIDIDTALCSSLTLLLYKKGLLGKVGPKSQLGHAKVDLQRMISLCTAVNDTRHDTVEFQLASNCKIRVEFKIIVTKMGNLKYIFDAESFEDCVMPEHNEALWGPVPLSRLPAGQTNTCSVASHRVRDTRGKVVFTARVIHSLPLFMSVIHVFYHDKLSVVAHLIGPDTLPLPNQVSSDQCITVNPSEGQRTLVIKNNDGDWAIVVGYWTGIRKGIPGVKGTKYTRGVRGVPGCPGYLEVKMYKMSTASWSTLCLSRWNSTDVYEFDFNDVHVDMTHSSITSAAAAGEVAENIALAFSVSLLHVLCQPRPSDWEPGQSLAPKSVARGGKTISRLPAEKLKLLLAMGLLVSTPSNHYLRKKLKQKRSAHAPFILYPAGDGTVSGAVTDVHYDDVTDCTPDLGEDQQTAWEEAFIESYEIENTDVDADGDGDPGGCGGCGGCGGGGGGGWSDAGGGGWGDSGGGDGGGDLGGSGGWGGDSGGDGGGGDGGGGDGGGCGGGGCGGGCGGCGG